MTLNGITTADARCLCGSWAFHCNVCYDDDDGVDEKGSINSQTCRSLRLRNVTPLEAKITQSEMSEMSDMGDINKMLSYRRETALQSA